MSQREPAILLVTCCLEETRHDVLGSVIDNIVNVCPPDWRRRITVFDNASTHPGTLDALRVFDNVHVADRNVGYWSAIDWWLNGLRNTPPAYTYVIESDMVHYRPETLDKCVRFLDDHPELGAMRLLEYSVADRVLYDKDRPVTGSRRNHWQSHVNRALGAPVEHRHVEGPFWSTNFLTQLPALNRYDAMLRCFAELSRRQAFTEHDFQSLYHDIHPTISLVDGGIFNCNLTHGHAETVSASWTDDVTMRRLGYRPTRHASIVPSDQYTVTRLA